MYGCALCSIVHLGLVLGAHVLRDRDIVASGIEPVVEHGGGLGQRAGVLREPHLAVL